MKSCVANTQNRCSDTAIQEARLTCKAYATQHRTLPGVCPLGWGFVLEINILATKL